MRKQCASAALQFALQCNLRADYNFDSPAAVDEPVMLECIDSLRSGRSYDLPVYSFTSHSRSTEQTRRVDPAQLCKTCLARSCLSLPCLQCAHSCTPLSAAPGQTATCSWHVWRRMLVACGHNVPCHAMRHLQHRKVGAASMVAALRPQARPGPFAALENEACPYFLVWRADRKHVS